MKIEKCVQIKIGTAPFLLIFPGIDFLMHFGHGWGMGGIGRDGAGWSEMGRDRAGWGVHLHAHRCRQDPEDGIFARFQHVA